MSTTIPRINITPSKAARAALLKLAKRDRASVAAKAAEYLEIGLSVSEDLALVDIATIRSATSRTEYKTHDEAWT